MLCFQGLPQGDEQRQTMDKHRDDVRLLPFSSVLTLVYLLWMSWRHTRTHPTCPLPTRAVLGHVGHLTQQSSQYLGLNVTAILGQSLVSSYRNFC
uniref:Uncharacterized protein n=1 Tax=Timema monikensis TaxID=170555 RepID=A0A7R9ECB0_9NEOP|nr:unnamed protein product [Timema monikensis]